jgi:MSHA biogenesis protein MshQ
VGIPAALSVLGADNGGEAGLSYTWSVVSMPVGATAPVFGVNGTNTAKNTTATFSTIGSYTLRATISDGSLSTTSNVTFTAVAAPTGDVTTGLVHRWKFDEGTGTTTADTTGTNSGSLTNGVAWVSGKAGAALNLDGVNDYVATASNLATSLGGTATLTAWINTTQVGSSSYWTAPGIVGVERHWHDNDVFWGILDAQGRVKVQAGDAAAASSTVAVNDGLWHHLAFTRNASTGQLQVYVDGVLQGSAVGATGAKTTPFSSIGRIENTNGPATYLKGGLDDVRVYSRILTASEIIAVKANPA